jgi:NAD(P)-dependent dehydrogenase (short-subunit alcohol dehydrogenase family)
MGAAKAALDSLARYFAVALAKRGIIVNVISPGATEDSVGGYLGAANRNPIWHAIPVEHKSWNAMQESRLPPLNTADTPMERAGTIAGKTNSD